MSTWPLQPVARATPGTAQRDVSLRVTNEFAAVELHMEPTRQGDRLCLSVLPEGPRILLDAMQLEAIATLQPQDFSRMLAKHLGACDDAEGL